MADLPPVKHLRARDRLPILGGYHHHLAFNTWRGEGVPPVPEDAVGLRHWTLLLDGRDLEAWRGRLAAGGIDTDARYGGVLVRDPWNNALLVAERGA